MSDIAFYGTMSKKDSKIITGELAGKNGHDVRSFIVAAGKKFREDNLKNDSKIDNALEDGFDMFNREWNFNFGINFLIDKWEWFVDEEYFSFKIHELAIFWNAKNWVIFVKELANKIIDEYYRYDDNVVGFNKRGLTNAVNHVKKYYFYKVELFKAGDVDFGDYKEKIIKLQLEFEHDGKKYNEEADILVRYINVNDIVRKINIGLEYIKDSLEKNYAPYGKYLEYKK